MGYIKDYFVKEPARALARIQAVAAAVGAALYAFDIWQPSQEQAAAILAVYGAVGLLFGDIVRAKVTPVA